MLSLAAGVRVREEEESLIQDQAIVEDEVIQTTQIEADKAQDVLKAWQVEAAGVDHTAHPARCEEDARFHPTRMIHCRHLWRNDLRYVLICSRGHLF
jgi:hypothetical protein